MKIPYTNIHILKEDTLDEVVKTAKHDALIVPNGMITRLLHSHADKPMLKQLVARIKELVSENIYLRGRLGQS